MEIIPDITINLFSDAIWAISVFLISKYLYKKSI